MRLANSGDLLWQKCFGGTQWENVESVIKIKDGDFFLTGATTSNDGDVSGFNGGSDIWLVKFDSTGTIKWQKCFGGDKSDYGTSFLELSDGTFLLGGNSESLDSVIIDFNPDSNYRIFRTNANGDILWDLNLGGEEDESLESLLEESNGIITIAGSSESNDNSVPNNYGESDAWIVQVKNGETSSVPHMQSKSQTTIFPNPADNEICLKNLNKANYLKIYDFIGNTVWCRDISSFSSELSINVSHFSMGLYVIQIINQHDSEVYSKLSIIH